jgi:hypothetical protein
MVRIFGKSRSRKGANRLLADGDSITKPTLASESHEIRKAMAFVDFFRGIGSAVTMQQR